MSDFLEIKLKQLAEFQQKHTKLLAGIIILLTITLGIGLKDLSINSDVRNEMPLEMPIFKINDRVSDNFGGRDTVIIAVMMDESVDSDRAIRDIRDPRVIQSLIFLEDALLDKESVTSVSSPASLFRGREDISPDEISSAMKNNPYVSGFFSKNYKTALMYISADIGSGEDKVKKFNAMVQEQIDYTPKPPGVVFRVTGAPNMRITIFELLKRDAVVTLAVSASIILLLLFVMQRSYTKGLLVFFPLSFGLIWTMGTLGWLGIPLSVATVSLSSMILGLGVEYGVFMVTRYGEERAKKENQLESLKTTVHGIGSAIIGSGMTTMVGFGALSFATVPMIQHLGQTLALGIAFCLLAALFATPVMLLLEEEYEVWNTQRKLKKLSLKREKHLEW
ncbi:MAG: MMPL family transporter [Candidatus Methanoperedens sp.]|nr:MMPL family transporter [Candidatus Methanoperedens sp.]